jgi:hypothetical protein
MSRFIFPVSLFSISGGLRRLKHEPCCTDIPTVICQRRVPRLGDQSEGRSNQVDRGTEWMVVPSVSLFCRIKSGIVLSDKPKEVKRTQRRFALPVS